MKFSVTDLLKIAEENKEILKVKPVKGVNDVHRFILALDIKDGKFLVKNAVIYQAYKMWSAKKLPLKSFFNLFSKFFAQQRTKNYRYYFLNYRSVELLNQIDNSKFKV